MTPDNNSNGQTPTLGDVPSLDNTPPTPAENIPDPTAVLDAPTSDNSSADNTVSQPAGGIEIKDPTADILNSLNKEAADPMASTVDPTAKPADESAKPAKQPGDKKKIISIAIIAVVALALIICGIIFLPKLFKGGGGKVTVYDDKVFFVERSSNDGHFAIFDADGNQQTDFLFSQVSDFSGGVAVACDPDVNIGCGVVNSKGEQTIKFGEYDTVSKVGGLFLVTKGEKRYIVNYSNDIILNLPSDNADDSKSFIYDDDLPFFIHKYEEERYRLYNATGESILEFTSVEQPYIFGSYNLDNRAFLSSSNKMRIINVATGEIIKEAPTERIYDYVKEVSPSKERAIIGNSRNQKRSNTFAYYHNDNIVDIDGNTCDTVEFAKNTTDQTIEIMSCGSYRIEEDGVIGEILEKYAYSYDTYIDSRYDKETASYVLTFMKDGEAVKDVPIQAPIGALRGNVSANSYSIRMKESDGIMDGYKKAFLYSLDGELLTEYDFAYPDILNDIYGPFPDGNYIINACASENCLTNYEMTLYNSKNEKISEGKYRSITRRNGLYFATPADYSSDADVLNAKGDIIATTNRNIDYNQNTMALGDGYEYFVDADSNTKGYIYNSKGDKIADVSGVPSFIEKKYYSVIKAGNKIFYLKKTDNSIFYQN